MNLFGIEIPMWMMVVAPVLLFVVCLLGFLAIRISPIARVEIFGTRIDIYHLPLWRMRRIPKCSAFLALSDETAWLGHGTAKYVKDKADYGLDDRVRELAPIAPGTVVTIPVKRLPAKHLIVANMHGDSKRLDSNSFYQGFDAAVVALGKVEPNSVFPGNSLMMGDPTDDWNYFEQRISPNAVAELVLDAIAKCAGRIGAVRIIVSKDENVMAYKQEIERLSEIRHEYSKDIKQQESLS